MKRCSKRRPAAAAFRRQPPAAQRMKIQSQKLRLLAVAASLATFTREQLAVEAWKRYPADFCLTGFPEHPDVTKVRQAMYGRRGLIAFGCLAPVSTNVYQITSRGRQACRAEP